MMARVFATHDTDLMQLFCFVSLTWLTQPCICLHHVVSRSRSRCHNPAHAYGREASLHLKLMNAHRIELFSKSIFACVRLLVLVYASQTYTGVLWHQVYIDEHSMSIMHVCSDSEKVNADYLIQQKVKKM